MQGAYLLQIAGSTSGDLSITKDDLLCCAAAQGAHNAREDLLLADQGRVLAWDEPGQAPGLASGDQCHLHTRYNR